MGGKKRGQLTVFDGTNKESGGKKRQAGYWRMRGVIPGLCSITEFVPGICFGVPALYFPFFFCYAVSLFSALRRGCS